MQGHAHPGVLAIAALAAAFTLLVLTPAPAAPAARAPSPTPPRPAPPTAPALAATPAASVPTVAVVGQPRRYVVRAPDTLAGVAARYLGDAARWTEIRALNRGTLASPDLIHPGDRLRLPDDAAGLPVAHAERRSRVRAGEALWRIAAAALGDPARWPELYRENRGRVASPGLLEPGWVLRLPPKAGGA